MTQRFSSQAAAAISVIVGLICLELVQRGMESSHLARNESRVVGKVGKNVDYSRLLPSLTSSVMAQAESPNAPEQRQAVLPVVSVKKSEKAEAPLKLSVNYKLQLQEAWLGCSLYPKGVRDLIEQGKHEAVRITKGADIKAWDVPADFVGGTWEVAIWERRVERNDCKLTEGGCAFCKKFGYHLEGTGRRALVYKSGLLSDAPAGWISTALIQPGASDSKMVLTVTGEMRNSSAWLGRSFYPPIYKDGLKEGIHHMKTYVKEGEFSEDLPVPTKAKGGWYEVALWQKRVEQKDCKVEGCKACPVLGYHGEVQLSYTGILPVPVLADKLKAEIHRDGERRRLILSGELIGGSAWLGTSFYPPGITDPVREGKHELSRKPLAEGPINLPLTLEAKFIGGTYEIALWRAKVMKANCKGGPCAMCDKVGYHLEGQVVRGYLSGRIE